MSGTVTISIEEYNRLRDRDILLSQMELKQVVIRESIWTGHIITVVESHDAAILLLSKKLGDTAFKLQMTREKLDELKIKQTKKRWFQL